MTNKDEFWPYEHRDYGPDYDKDGWAVSVPKDDPARQIKEAIDFLSGEVPSLWIRKDYSTLFRESFQLPDAITEVEVRTKDPAMHAGNVPFEAIYRLNGVRYGIVLSLQQRLFHDQASFDTWRNRLFIDFARRMTYTAEENCIHFWEWRPDNLTQHYLECKHCGLKRSPEAAPHDDIR